MGQRYFIGTAVLFSETIFPLKICNAEADKKEKKAVGKQIAFWLPFLVILQTARIYSRATDKSTLLAVCSRDSLQVLVVCSIDPQGYK